MREEIKDALKKMEGVKTAGIEEEMLKKMEVLA